jgi:hypothetical protein
MKNRKLNTEQGALTPCDQLENEPREGPSHTHNTLFPFPLSSKFSHIPTAALVDELLDRIEAQRCALIRAACVLGVEV